MKAQIIKNNNNSIFCETYNCRNRASYFIGNPQGPRMLFRNICEDCLKSVIDTMPKELTKKTEAEIKPESHEKETLKGNVCDICGYVAKSSSGLSSHIRAKHGG